MTDQEKINQLKDAHMSLRLEMRVLSGACEAHARWAASSGSATLFRSLGSTMEKALEDDSKVISEILYT